MKSLEFIWRASLWLLLAAGIALTGAAAWLTVSTERSRPESALPSVPEPPPPSRAPQTAPAPAPENGAPDTHYRARPVTRTPDPSPEPTAEPAFRIDETVFIRTRSQDTNRLNALIRRDIRRAGGQVRRDGSEESARIDARVSQEYLERIEPLLRRSDHHINPHYADWADWTEHNPPGADRGPNEVAASLQVAGRIFDDPRDAVRTGWLFGGGLIMTVAAAAALGIRAAIRCEEQAAQEAA